MATPRALIITAAGINCDLELGGAFELAGAAVEYLHLNDLIREPDRLDRFNLIGLPGGFSFGDAVAAGRIMAQLIRQSLYQPLVAAVKRGVPIIAPCNGFQIAVQAGLLPGPFEGDWPRSPARPRLALAANSSARFIDRWCRVKIPANTRCIWTKGIQPAPEAALLPIAHGEGRLVAESEDLLNSIEARGQVALRYATDDNPNGSARDIAGICDESGLIFGLMPHPERYTSWKLHPTWTRLDAAARAGDPPGLQMFKNAVSHARSLRSPQAAVAAR